MGAVPYEGGVTFRIWAPFARSVAVAGTFNGWSTAAHQLEREPAASAYWSTDVDGAGVGDEYKFFIEGASPPWRIDPYARAVTNSAGNGVIAETEFLWSDQSYVLPDHRELVIYEIHTGTFTDPARPHERGSFRTIAAQFPYLRDLGVNVIKIMAAGEFPTDVSLGYNPAHIFAIESSYGGPNAFRALVDAANAHGIGVILDVVYNHFGPNDTPLWELDGWRERDGGGIYFYNDQWKRKTPWGDRPDYGRAEVRRYIRDNALRWVESRGADGLRWDATNYIRNLGGRNDDPGGDIPEGWRMMQEINGELAQVAPHAIRIAEDMQDNEWIVKPPHEGGAGFHAQWSAKFVHTLRDAVIPSDDGARDMHAVRAAIEQKYNGAAFSRVIYTESHDEVRNGRARVPHDIDPNDAGGWLARKRSTLGAALALTAPGIPMLFQGQEFVEDRWFEAEHLLDWTKRERFGGIVQLYRDLIRLRRNWFDHTRGLRGDQVNVFHVNDRDKLIAFHRWAFGGPGDDVVVIANFANRGYTDYRLGFPRAGRWRVRFNSDWNGYNPDFGNWFSGDVEAWPPGHDAMPAAASIGIGPYTVLVLSQD
jgi:1,4-alpha-glucan branching enzyme